MREISDLPELDLTGGHLSEILNDQDNPWLTLGIMDQIEDPNLLREWIRMLDLQTRLLGHQEVEWLRTNGFGDNCTVMEPGSGDGRYGSFLARSFRDTRIFGLEANENIAKRFDASQSTENYGIDICKVGSDPLPEKLSQGCDQCFLRFVLQHISDPRPLLKAVYDALPPGGKIYIIEEDHSFFTSEPYWLPYSLATDAWARVYAAGGSDGGIGRKLPALVAEAGFAVDAFDIVLRNNVEMGDSFLGLFEQASRVLHYTSPELLPRAELRRIETEFRADRDRHLESFVATYPQILLCATKR
jgi:SAM-dependent methyltransferase